MIAESASIPSHWEYTTLGEIAEIQSGITKGKQRKAGDSLLQVPYLRVANVQRGHIDLRELKTIEVTASELESLRLLPGDILLNEGGDRDKLGRGWVWEGLVEDCIHQNHVFRARVSPQCVDPRFLSYYTNQVGAKYFWDAGKHTTGIASINRTQLAALPVRLPPLAEQRRIVAKLEDHLARVRRSRSALDAIPSLLERFRQTVLAFAFTGRLTAAWRQKHKHLQPAEVVVQATPIPQRPSRFESRSSSHYRGDFALCVNKPPQPHPIPTWCWTNLVDVARLESGHTPSRSHPEWWGGDVPWLSIPDAREHHGKTITYTTQSTNADGLANSAARLLPAGTVCLSRTASVGYVTIIGRPMATSQDFVNWTCTPVVNPEWLKFLFMAEKAALLRFGKGSTHTTIYFPEVLSFAVALPPLDEQAEIVRHLQAAFNFTDEVALQCQLQERFEQLESAILSKAFRGELVPQDPADEPASALLERIRAKRAASVDSAKKPKGRRASHSTG